MVLNLPLLSTAPSHQVMKTYRGLEVKVYTLAVSHFSAIGIFNNSSTNFCGKIVYYLTFVHLKFVHMSHKINSKFAFDIALSTEM